MDGGQQCQPTNNLKKESESNRPVPALPYLRDKNNASTSAGYNNYQSNNHKKTHYYNKKQEEHRLNGKNIRREKSHQQDNER